MPEASVNFPDWSSLADTLISHLRHHHGMASRQSSGAKTVSGPSNLDDLFEKFRTENGLEHFGPVAAPSSSHVPARQILTAIRIAATLGSNAGVEVAQQSGALTIIQNIADHDLETFHDVLQICFPRARWQLISPDVLDGAVTKTSQRRFESVITDSFDQLQPILILHASGISLPGFVQAIAPACLPLAPISREILIAALRFGHLADQFAKTDHLREALPDDGALAALDTMAACAALRAPNLSTAMARLKAMVAQGAGSGPRLEDMPGDSAALRAARRMVTDLRLWQRGDVGWNEISRSLLLYGPPGTGKTWLARAMGRSVGIAFVTATFAEWQAAGHLGHMLREMAASFAEARQRAPCILFIDEIDAVGSRTDGDRHAVNYRTQVINAFLGEMNGVAAREGLIVVGACNNPEQIDPAVLRAGRFDLKIEVPLPDSDMLLATLRHRLRKEISDDALQTLARLAVGRSLADLDAAIRAARSDARHSGGALRMEMIASHLGISPEAEDRDYLWRIAVHEVGHAVIGAALDLGTSQSMWISREGGQISRQVIPNQSRLSDIEAEISYLLGGRAAERLILGEVSAGAGGPASSDLAAATRHAIMIETSYGLGHEGPVWHAKPDEVHLSTPAIRDRVRLRLSQAERRAGDILTRHRQTLESLAHELLHTRSMGAAEIEPWLREVRALPDPPAAIASLPASQDLAHPP